MEKRRVYLLLIIFILLVFFFQRDKIFRFHPQTEPKIRISCYISGAVNNPGVYSFENRATLADLLKKAGGVKPEADLTGQDLNRALQDGEVIVIGVKKRDLK